MAKFAIITGGSSGIGRHLVSAFVRDGYDVAFTHLGQSDAAAEVEAEVATLGGRAIGRECEVANSSTIEAFLDDVIAWAGQTPDVLVNNAGIQTWASMLELSEERWEMPLSVPISRVPS
jgi:3-oxoacyl-[acyl-carrier protein] reductase